METAAVDMKFESFFKSQLQIQIQFVALLTKLY